jgi:putative Mn2+ efflux pump MntP
MDFLTLLGIAVGLSMDALAVAIGTSVVLRGVTPRQVFRLSFHFGLFQALMPILGWALGSLAADHIRDYDHWVAFGLLVLVGGKAVYEAFSGGDEDRAERRDPTRGWSLLLLSVATSIDALAVGLTFAMLGITVWYPAIVIGFIAAALTMAGMLFGSWLGQRFGKVMEVIGGLVLIAIGVKILAGHISFL